MITVDDELRKEVENRLAKWILELEKLIQENKNPPSRKPSLRGKFPCKTFEGNGAIWI